MSKATSNFVSKCKKFWDEADSDGSDNLSVGELGKIIRKVSSVEISDAEIAEMFLDLDDDGNKTLSWDEFSDVFKKKDPKKVQQSELKEAFSQMDKDGSGLLTADEIKAQYKSLGIEVPDETLDAHIGKFDADGDGRISYDEFLKTMP